jgi:hypothetical protein
MMTSNNPFRGLVTFTEKDPLFERDRDIDLLMSRFQSGRITVLFAGSGVGKSSFLNAKFVPALKDLFTSKNVRVPKDWARTTPARILEDIRKAITTEPRGEATNVVILDQFEEVFQHFPDPILLADVGTQLARIAKGQPWKRDEDNLTGNQDDIYGKAVEYEESLDIRLLISIREEFLAELSTFDDFLPGLFTNYYRLGKPTVEQARSIIQQTANLSDVRTSPNVEKLLEDLQRASEVDGSDLSGCVDLPYLQIVCERIWEREKPVGNIDRDDASFLASYNYGEARQQLDGYCRQVLDKRKRKEKRLLVKAFGQLTGPKEAKKYVRLTDLAREIGEKDPEPLNLILKKLSEDEVKILREWDEKTTAGGSSPYPEVYVLYHDMYAPLLWNWKTQREEVEQRWRLRWTVGLTGLFVFFLLYPFISWWGVNQMIKSAQGTADEIADIRGMRNALSYSIIWQWAGDHLWKEYLKELASRSALKGDTAGALAYKLASLGTSQKELSPESIDAILGPASDLTGTFVNSDQPTDGTFTDAVVVPANPKTQPKRSSEDVSEFSLFAGTSSGNILHWKPGGVYNKPDRMRPQIRELPAQRVICFAPNGKVALVLAVSDHQNQEDSIILGIVQVEDGNLLAESTPLPTPKHIQATMPSGFFDSGGVPMGTVSARDFPGQIATESMRGFFSSDSEHIGIIWNDTATIFNSKLRDPQTVSFGNGKPTSRVGDLGFFECATESLKCDPNVALVIPSQPIGHTQVLRWNPTNGKFVSQPNSSAKQHLLASDRLVFRRRDDTVLMRLDDSGKDWGWVSSTGKVTDKLTLPQNAIPQGFADENEEILISKDPSGVLTISQPNDGIQAAAVYNELVISEPRVSTTPEPRNVAMASIEGPDKHSRFLTIDNQGFALRLWSVPPLVIPLQSSSAAIHADQVTEEGEGKPSKINPCDSDPKKADTIFYSIDDDWKATVKTSPKSLGNRTYECYLEVRNNKPYPSNRFVWEVPLPPDKSGNIQTVALSVTGGRLLIMYPGTVRYIAMDGTDINIPRGMVKNGVFGPGKNRVTFVSASDATIYAFNSLQPRQEWQAPCANCKLLRSVHETGVVLYSGIWAHRLTEPDSFWGIMSLRAHRFFESRGNSPEITSVLSPVPIPLLQSEGIQDVPNAADNDTVQIVGPNLTIDFKAEAKNFPDRTNWLPFTPTVMRLDLCDSDEGSRPGFGIAGPKNVMCEWEVRSGTRLGSAAPK